MAHFYPANPDKDATYGEREVFRRLKSLDDSWVVLHSVHYVWSERGRTGMGEADFLLLHPQRGALVLEVKDSKYHVQARTWHRISRDGSRYVDTNPFEQAEKNRHRITTLIRDAGARFVPNGHCVVFVAGRPTGNLGAEAPPQIALTLDALDDATAAISNLVSFWSSRGWGGRDDFSIAVQALSPNATVAPSVDYEVDVALGEIERLTDAQTQLTERQLEIVRATSREPTSVVLGAAGTGKTFIAYAYARRLAKHEGRRVAVIGTPKQLRLLTRRRLAGQGFAAGDVRDVATEIYGSSAIEDVGDCSDWELVAELVMARGAQLDTLIVDEAQSFDDELIDALRAFLVPGGQTVLLGDPYQRDSSGMWRPNGDFTPYWLTENCRNALPIAKLVARISGAHPPVSGAAGPKPKLTTRLLPDYSAVASTFAPQLDALGPSRSVVLTRSERAANKSRDALRAIGLQVSRQLRNDAIAVLTADEFRGCEAHAVFYVADRDGGSDSRTANYVAVSRACAALTVAGVGEEWDAMDFLFESLDGFK